MNQTIEAIQHKNTVSASLVSTSEETSPSSILPSSGPLTVSNLIDVMKRMRVGDLGSVLQQHQVHHQQLLVSYTSSMKKLIELYKYIHKMNIDEGNEPKNINHQMILPGNVAGQLRDLEMELKSTSDVLKENVEEHEKMIKVVKTIDKAILHLSKNLNIITEPRQQQQQSQLQLPIPVITTSPPSATPAIVNPIAVATPGGFPLPPVELPTAPTPAPTPVTPPAPVAALPSHDHDHDHDHSHTHDNNNNNNQQTSTTTKAKKHIPHTLKDHHHNAHEGHDHSNKATVKSDEEYQKLFDACTKLQEEQGIMIGNNWGTATQEQQDWWKKSNCDDAIQHKQMADESTSEVQLPTESTGNKPTTNLPVIGICVSSTSRQSKASKKVIRQLSDLDLFVNLLPSLIRTAEPGYEYWMYLIYDKGDKFYDVPGRNEEITEWYNTNIAAPLKEKGIESRIVIVSFTNTFKRPGPAFNYVCRQAYIDGAEYIYRINDDTVFNAPWASLFINQLQAWGEPYGVVGPRCDQGNALILTHDFVHRVHHDIFPWHYPPIFSDWWMDDWITRVYGRSRTRRIRDAEVKHLLSPTKYEVNSSHGLHLDEEVELGHQHIAEWMSKHGHNQQEVEKFKQDSTRYQVTGDV